MKVLVDGRPIRTPFSGVAQYCAGLSHALSGPKVDCEISLLAQSKNGVNPVLENVRASFDFDVVENAVFNPKLMNAFIEYLPSWQHCFLQGDYDILHETYFANMGFKKGVSKVSTIHDVIPLDYPNLFNRLNRFYSKRNFYRQCRESSQIITVSKYTRQRVLDYCPHLENVHVVPCGLNKYEGKLDFDFLELNNLNSREFVFYVGNIEPRKNLVCFAQAFKNSKISKDISFVVAGHKNYLAEEIVNEIRSLLGNRFIYLGAVSESQKWALFNQARLFVFPSIYEGFGIPVIEAYQAGCPAIFSNNSSLAELEVLEGQAFNEKSIMDMAHVLENAIHNDEWRNNVIQKSSHFVQRFEWEKVAQETRLIYSLAVA